MQRVGEERIAQQYRRLGSIRARGRIAPTADVCAIHDIVVHQRREMHQLDHRGDPNQLRAHIVILPSTQKHQ